jgi:hypothetical protein
VGVGASVAPRSCPGEGGVRAAAADVYPADLFEQGLAKKKTATSVRAVFVAPPVEGAVTPPLRPLVMNVSAAARSGLSAA